MGIYDRDYYREDGGFLSRFAGQGLICKWIIALSIVAFLIQIFTRVMFAGFIYIPNSGPFTGSLELIPQNVMNGELWRLLTSAFLHDTGRAWHIIMNMVLLWWFGREIESHYGHREFVAFYLVAAIAGSVAFIGSAMVGLGNTSMQTRALGASGAVTAVMVLFACHYPRHTILLFFVIPMPVWLLIAISVGLDLIGLLQVSDGIRQQRVAFAAHLGGAAFAGAYFYFRLRLTSWMGGISLKRVVGTRPNPPLRVYREEPAEMLPEPVAPSRRVDEHLEAQLDMVLEKVARLGKASLTADEQEILQRASEAYKKRRR